MGAREVCWAVFLAGLPLAHWFWQLVHIPVDVYHAQAAWGMLGLAGCFSLVLAVPHQSKVCSKPLGVWTAWIVSSTIWNSVVYLTAHKEYDVMAYFGMFSVLVIPLFVWSAWATWTPGRLTLILRWVSRVGVVVMAYSLLQLLGLDQFYKHISTGSRNTTLMGTLGNSTHYAAYLSFLLPCLMLSPLLRWRIASGLCFGLLVYLAVSYASISGLVGAALGLVWWAWRFRDKRWGIGLASLLVLGSVWCVLHPTMLNPEGRFGALQHFWRIFTDVKSITGEGLGYVLRYKRSVPEGGVFWTWGHVHNEFLQAGIEQGAIGLGLLLWGVCQTFTRMWRSPVTRLSTALGTMWLAFCFNSLLSFPAHLWVLASFGLLAYSGIHLLALESADVPTNP